MQKVSDFRRYKVTVLVFHAGPFPVFGNELAAPCAVDEVGGESII